MTTTVLLCSCALLLLQGVYGQYGGGPSGNQNGECTETRPDREGPFYRRSWFSDKSQICPGESERLELAGHVYESSACDTPVTNAKVLIWQANSQGQYRRGCYGIATTDSTGAYVMDTVVPGRYQGRPLHIHIKVFKSDGTDWLTTQVYFESDSNPRKIPSNTREIKKNSLTFDIYSSDEVDEGGMNGRGPYPGGNGGGPFPGGNGRGPFPGGNGGNGGSGGDGNSGGIRFPWSDGWPWEKYGWPWEQEGWSWITGRVEGQGESEEDNGGWGEGAGTNGDGDRNSGRGPWSGGRPWEGGRPGGQGGGGRGGRGRGEGGRGAWWTT